MPQIWIKHPDADYLTEALSDAVMRGEVHGVMLEHSLAQETALLQQTCDALGALHARQEGGYVVMSLATQGANARAMVAEAKAWIAAVDRPNTMIALPATEAGIEATATLAAEGTALCVTHVFSPNQAMHAAEALDASPCGVVLVSVSAFDRKLNPLLQPHHLAQNRIGFFTATKIYNQIDALDRSHLRVAYDEMDGADTGCAREYYVENLTLPHTIHVLLPDLSSAISSREFEESFHFQTRHIDAFLGFLAPAGITMTRVETELLQERLAF